MMPLPRSARVAALVLKQDVPAVELPRADCPIVNPSYGKKSLTRAEAYELIETMARGLKVIDGR